MPLHTLNLAENRAGDAGAVALAAPLHANTTLRQSCLGHNLIGQAGMARLNNVLSLQHDEFNETLVQLPDVEKQEANHWKQNFVQVHGQDQSLSTYRGALLQVRALHGARATR